MMMATQTAQATPESELPRFIRALLSDTGCYAHTAGPLQLVETHISWVVLTGAYAYKIKKPVNLGFLDFSTLAQRLLACNEELRLNRRLAPELYLAVVPITGSPESPHIDTPHVDGRGEPFEYAVRMVQFPPDATLDRIAARGELGMEHIDALAARLAHFHQYECDIASAASPWGEPDAIARPVAENFQLLTAGLHEPTEMRRLDRLQAWCDAEHDRLSPLMRERKRAGHVRECHGDLHLANLAWVNDGLVIFDCLEFSPALRWIDVISEVAFCYMDLLHKQYGALASRFLNAWLEDTGDYQGIALLRYYAVYRALVRAKVALLRAGQIADGDDQVQECMQLAERLTQPTLPLLWITHGLSGSGKTTLSQAWLQQHGMIRLRSDVERKRLAGIDALARSGIGVDQGLYTQQASRRTYAHLAHLAQSLLKAGWPVIVDAAFLQREQRDLFRELAQQHRVPFRIMDVQADIATLRQRVSLRAAQGTDASEADLAVLQHQLDTNQPLADDELYFQTVV